MALIIYELFALTRTTQEGLQLLLLIHFKVPSSNKKLKSSRRGDDQGQYSIELIMNLIEGTLINDNFRSYT